MEKLSRIFKGIFSPSEKEIIIKTNEIIDYLNGDSGEGSYRVYRAIVYKESGAVAPTANVLENTLGFTPTLSYSDVGYYTISNVGGFDRTKTFVTYSYDRSIGGGSTLMEAYAYKDINDDTTIWIESYLSQVVGSDITPVFDDEILFVKPLSIEIIVYN